MAEDISMFLQEGVVDTSEAVPQALFTGENFEEVAAYHNGLEAYEPTQLVSLGGLARQLGLGGLFVKDESTRFGLKAFKGLGSSYAIDRLLQREGDWGQTFVTCTDGNHGKSVAWAARTVGHPALVFMPKGSEDRRVCAIEEQGAQVTVTDMSYDDTVAYAAQLAADKGYSLLQDTAFEGYEQVPGDIMLGYSTMIREALDQLEVARYNRPTHVFLQAGVGSMAAGVAGYLAYRYPGELPLIAIMEAEDSACVFESLKAGYPVSVPGESYTLMAGLNCGTVSTLAYPVLKDLTRACFKCADSITRDGMARAGGPIASDAVIDAGESGAVGLGLVEHLMGDPACAEMREQLGLDESSVVLLFNTEGVLEEHDNGYIQCKACGHCCEINIICVSPEEVATIREYIARHGIEPVDHDKERCPFVQDGGRCGIYEVRPQICRLHNCRVPRTEVLRRNPSIVVDDDKPLIDLHDTFILGDASDPRYR